MKAGAVHTGCAAAENMPNATSTLLLIAGLAAAGCGSSDPPPAAERPARAARPAAAPAKVPVKIVKVEPDTIMVHHGTAVPGEYTVHYLIGEPEKVEEAKVTVYVPGVDDVILKQDVHIVAADTATFTIAPRWDFGPTLRFRAVCPQGTTDWFTYGSELLPLEERMAPGLRIANVGPERIFYNLTGQEGGSQRISILGRELGPGCKPEGEVNGQPVELSGTMAQKGKIETLLRRDDFGDTAVAKRYLEVKLSVKGPGFAKVAIERIHFVE